MTTKPRPPVEVHPICGRLHRERLDKGWTQRDVAEQMDVWQSGISDYETGASVPMLATLDRWAAAFGYAVVLVPKESS